jgi:hypothetical protein
MFYVMSLSCSMSSVLWCVQEYRGTFVRGGKSAGRRKNVRQNSRVLLFYFILSWPSSRVSRLWKVVGCSAEQSFCLSFDVFVFVFVFWKCSNNLSMTDSR